MREPDPTLVHDDAADESAIRAAFLVALLEDRERGRGHDLAHYQQRFRGYEHVVAAEFRAFAAGGDDGDERADGGGGEGLPRYRVDGELGRGGMGVVQRVFDTRLHRYLARKQVRAGAGEAETARFLEEARVTAQLDHPGVVAVHEVGRDEEGAPYFTMPMVRGRTFAALIDELRAGPTPPWTRVVDVLVRVCDTVAFAHSRGVVHRDLKPQNVMVGRFGEVFVVDWGLARALGRPVADARRAEGAQATAAAEVPARDSTETPNWTLAGDVLGTPAYMAPEQLVRSDDVSCGMDVYAIGAILYHALAGHAPYDSPAERADDRSVLERAAAGPPSAIHEIAPDAPAELCAICERAMARDPRRRYADAEALRDDLRAFADGRVVGAYERGAWARVRKWVRRNRLLTAAACSTLLALLIGLFASLAHAKRADASFHDSVAAVDRMLTRVARAKLQNVPETTPLRRDLLDDATAFFERFLAQRPDDLELRFRAAVSYYRVASLHEQLGDHDAALHANARSLELTDAALRERPDDPDLLRQATQAHLQRGSELAEAGENHEAALETARSFAERRLAIARDSEALSAAGTVLDALALSSYRARRLDDAERYANASAELCKELVERFGEAHRGQASTPHSLLAGVMAERGDDAGSAEQLRLTIAARRSHLARFPDAAPARSKLAEALRNHAILLHRLRQEAEAEACAAEAVELRAGLAQQNPRVPGYHASHADALVHRARIRHENGAPVDALAFTAEALAATQRALALDPDSRHAATVAFDARRVRHRAASRLALHDEVAENATALAALTPSPAAWRFEAACQLAHAVQLLDAATLAAAERERLQREYGDRAVAWLRQLCEDDGLPRDRLADARLDPLRRHPDFPTPR